MDLIDGDMKDYEKKESSGSSIVYVKQDSNTVYQIFKSENTAKRIANIMLKLVDKNIDYRIYMSKGFGEGKQVFIDETIVFSSFKYIVPFELYIPYKKAIAWKKITPLNSVRLYTEPEFLRKNLYKIWYDISKALLTLRSINIIHNDTTIDNIGIYNGNFVLFDFDGSGTPEEKGKDKDVDYYTLHKSFSYREIDCPEFPGINSIIQHFSKDNNISIIEAFNRLENMEIRYD